MANKEDRLFVKNAFRHYRKTYNVTEVYLGAVVVAGLACIGGWVAYKGQHPDPGLAALDVVPTGTPNKIVARGPMPKDLALPGWKEGGLRIFSPKNLYEKINGRAGYYKSFGVQSLHFMTLEMTGETNILVDLELFDLGRSANALGAYNGERDKEATPTVGDQGLTHVSRNALYLTRGRYYLRALGADESEPVLAQLAKIRERFEAELDGEALPWAYALFLGRLQFSPDAIGYFTENAFGFSDFASDVNVGRLADETELFVKTTDSETTAAKIAEQFNDGFRSYGELKGDGFTEDRYIQTLSKATHLDAWVYGVRGAPDMPSAIAGLARLKTALTGFEIPDALPSQQTTESAPPSPEPAYDETGGAEQ